MVSPVNPATSQEAEVKSAVVVTAHNHAHFLSDALDSCIRQTARVDHIIVVDDGSTDDPASVVAKYSGAHGGIRFVRQGNRGLAAARNTGLAATNATFVTFLDADDRLLPEAMEAGIRHLEARTGAAMVYGAYRFIDAEGRPISAKLQVPVFSDHYLLFLRRGNFISMHATVMYRSEHLIAAGGFDENFRACEDYELFMRIAKSAPIYSHGTLVAEYRKHGQNMSLDRPMMLATALRALDVQMSSEMTSEERDATIEGRKFWTDYYAAELAKDGLRQLFSRPAKMIIQSIWMAPLSFVKTCGEKVVLRILKFIPSFLGRRLIGRDWPPPLGAVKFGDFGRTEPISSSFGYDRGQPIDRYYIENFLRRFASDIRGRVLEIGDNRYTTHFGGKNVVKSDVLHVDAGNPNATIVGDLSEPGVLPAHAFDCIILTQTLHLIFDMPKAVAALAVGLKPGGILLLTVPGITPVDRGEWGNSWFWSLTEAALARLLAGSFEPTNIFVETFGNVFAAVSFLQGLALSEVSTEKLDVRDFGLSGGGHCADHKGNVVMIRLVLRRLRRAVRGGLAGGAPIILMYHRVANIAVDPWQLAVCPSRFDEQIDALQRTRRVVHLHELMDAEARRSRSDKPLAAVTFDDGYQDVYSTARHILRRRDCPMTLFVTTGPVGSDREFWWDTLTRVFLETQSLPAEIATTIRGESRRWAIPPSTDRVGRDKVYCEVWASLRELPHEDQDRLVIEIARWAGCDLTSRAEHRVMTKDEVRDICDGLISIGTHTINHPSLPAHSFEAQRREVADSRSACEALTGRPVDMFAYPFGDHDDRTVSVVRQAGFRYACTTHAGVVRPGADPMRLPRLHIGNWNGDEFLRKIEDCSLL